MDTLRAYIHSNIGHCIVCMRTAFQASLSFWIATLVLLILEFTHISHILFLLSVFLSTLWLMHLLAYAARNVGYIDHHERNLTFQFKAFLRFFTFAAIETIALYKSRPRDRFGKHIGNRPILAILKNPDGSRTAYFKEQEDISALISELEKRGYTGSLIKEDYWMSTDSCERSNGKYCNTNTCDSSAQSCRQFGTGLQYCRCN